MNYMGIGFEWFFFFFFQNNTNFQTISLVTFSKLFRKQYNKLDFEMLN